MLSLRGGHLTWELILRNWFIVCSNVLHCLCSKLCISKDNIRPVHSLIYDVMTDQDWRNFIDSMQRIWMRIFELTTMKERFLHLFTFKLWTRFSSNTRICFQIILFFLTINQKDLMIHNWKPGKILDGLGGKNWTRTMF